MSDSTSFTSGYACLLVHWLHQNLWAHYRFIQLAPFPNWISSRIYRVHHPWQALWHSHSHLLQGTVAKHWTCQPLSWASQTHLMSSVDLSQGHTSQQVLGSHPLRAMPAVFLSSSKLSSVLWKLNQSEPWGALCQWQPSGLVDNYCQHHILPMLWQES